MKTEKITAPFHPITATEARQWYEDGLLTVTGYLWAIRRITCPPHVQFVIPNVVAFCEDWGIPRPSFYRAVDHLKTKGYMTWEATHGLMFTDSSKVVDFPQADKKCLKNETVSRKRTGCLENGQGVSKTDRVSQKRDSGIYIDRARSSDISDIQITTNTAVVVAEKNEPEEEPIPQPTNQQVSEAIAEMQRIWPAIKDNPTVRKSLLTYWTNFPAAREAVKIALQDGTLKNPTGYFVSQLKSPPTASESPAIETRNFPPVPTEEQKEELATLGNVYERKIFDQRYPSVMCVHVKIGSDVILWWEALELSLDDLMQRT